MQHSNNSLLLCDGITFRAERRTNGSLDPRGNWNLVVGDNETGRATFNSLKTWADVEARVRRHYGLVQ